MVKEAITYVAHETGHDKKIVEQILDDLFVNAKKLIIEMVVDNFKILNFGGFTRRKSGIERAERQLLKEQKLREELISKMSND